MADWSLPGLTDIYADFLTYLKARDFDAISLGYSTITNPATGMMRYVRASDKFQEYDGATWQDKTLALAGGGTGAATASDARSNLGLGTIATQNANNVTITGGVVSGLSSLAVTGTSATSVQTGGGITAGSGAVGIVDTTGKIPAISSTYFASLSGANLTNLNASNLASGTVAAARLGSGSGGATKFLREDSTWQDITLLKRIVLVDTTVDLTSASGNITLGTTLTDYTKAFISIAQIGGGNTSPHHIAFKITSNSNIAWDATNQSGADTTYRVRLYVVEFA